MWYYQRLYEEMEGLSTQNLADKWKSYTVNTFKKLGELEEVPDDVIEVIEEFASKCMD